MSMKRSWRASIVVAASLDDFIAKKDGDTGWLADDTYAPHELQPYQSACPPPAYDEVLRGVDHIVMGRKTYETMRTFEQWPYFHQHVIVISSTLPQGQDTRVTVTRTIDQAVQLMNDRRARGVYVDGGRTIQGFMQRDLIDDITLTRAPILLGEGIPLFGNLNHEIRLTHTGTSWGDDGMITSHYIVQSADAVSRSTETFSEPPMVQERAG